MGHYLKPPIKSLSFTSIIIPSVYLWLCMFVCVFVTSKFETLTRLKELWVFKEMNVESAITEFV